MQRFYLVVALASALSAASCAREQKAAPPPPPPEVQVVVVEQRDEPIYSEWIGTLDGMVNADIRPKVDGYLERRLYDEGAYVRQGAALFDIDPRQAQAALEQTIGVLAHAQAALEKATRDVQRYTPLAAENAISQEELDNARSFEREAIAAVAAAQANVDQARLNRNWTRVNSPISGIVGTAKAQVGDLVSPQTVMTTVSQVDPIKVTVNISEQEYLRYAKVINQGLAGIRGQDLLELILDDGSVFPKKGNVLSVNRQIDVRTGTIAATGVFANPGNILRPGQYVKVRVPFETRKDALLVPQRAVNELQGSFQVGVVSADGKADIRVVTPGERVGSLWIIEKGLSPGDRVIVEGFNRVRPGMPVTAKPAGTPAPAATPAAPAGH